MKVLEDKLKSLNAQYRALGPPSIPLHGKAHSSILRGVAAQALGGPVAGAITYAMTEAQNKAVASTNSSIRAEYSLREELGEKIDDTQNKLNELYTKVIHTHDKSVQIHLYSVKNVY